MNTARTLREHRSPSAIISGVIGRQDTDSGRYYVRPSDDLVLDSVTTILGSTSDQVFYKNWLAKLGGIVATKYRGEICALFDRPSRSAVRAVFDKKKGRQADVYKSLNSGGFNAARRLVAEICVENFVAAKVKFLSEIKADIGSHQHHVLEALVLDETIPDVPEHLVDIEVDGDMVDHDAISDGLLRFFTDFPDAIIEMAEATVANPDLGTAGTLDLVVYFPTGITIDGVTYYRLIIDLKAGKWLKATMRAQLAAYRFSTEIWVDTLGNTVPMLETDGAAILHLRRDYEAGYKLIIVHAGAAELQWFSDCVKTFRTNEDYAACKRLGKVAYPPLPDGSQPLPLIEDLDTEGMGHCRNKLRAAGLRRLEDLSRFSESDVRAVRGIGPKAIEACKIALGSYGLNFAKEKEKEHDAA